MNERTSAGVILERLWTRVWWMERYISEMALAVVEDGGKASQSSTMSFQLPMTSFQERDRRGSIIALLELFPTLAVLLISLDPMAGTRVRGGRCEISHSDTEYLRCSGREMMLAFAVHMLLRIAAMVAVGVERWDIFFFLEESHETNCVSSHP